MAITNISVFRSTDTGAVSGSNGRCAGTAGDAILLFNQCLLNGYNWQEVTAANLTQTDNVATLVKSSHGFNIDQRLWLVGTDQSGYVNDALYPSSIVDHNTITFAVTGNPASPATASGSTTANGAIGSTTSTSITVTSAASFPASGQYAIKIDSEYMLVTAGQGTTTWTVVRGFARSTAATHLNGATITQVILIGVAPAGGYNHWTADYTATNKSTYRPPGGNRMWFDVDDSGSGFAANYFMVRGYETMTAVATGTNPFPTLAQKAVNTTHVTKSGTADTVARPWVMTATDRMLYLIIDSSSNYGGSTVPSGQFFFTDLIDQTKTGDAYATMIMFEGSASTGQVSAYLTTSATTDSRQYMPRAYTQVAGSISAGKRVLDRRVVTRAPHPPDGTDYLTRLYVADGASNVTRGILPGLYFTMHTNVPFSHLDTFTGNVGSGTGKKFLCVYVYSGYPICFEISNTIQAT